MNVIVNGDTCKVWSGKVRGAARSYNVNLVWCWAPRKVPEEGSLKLPSKEVWA